MVTVQLNKIKLAYVDTSQQIRKRFIFLEGKFPLQACEAQQREDAESGQSICLFSFFVMVPKPYTKNPPLTHIVAKCFLLVRLVFQGGQSRSFVSTWCLCKSVCPVQPLSWADGVPWSGRASKMLAQKCWVQGLWCPPQHGWCHAIQNALTPPIPVCAVRGLAFPGVPLMKPVWCKGPINRTGAKRM